MTKQRAIELLKELSAGVGTCVTEEDIEALDLILKLVAKK